MSSNPSTVYWMDIFSHIKRRKYTKKTVDGPLIKKVSCCCSSLVVVETESMTVAAAANVVYWHF